MRASKLRRCVAKLRTAPGRCDHHTGSASTGWVAYETANSTLTHDVIEESGGLDRVDGRGEEFDVVAVRFIDRPAERDTVTLDADRPLPAELRPICGVLAGAFAAVGGLVQAAIDGDLAQVETDDPAERRHRLSVDLVEDASVDPFVAAGTQRVSETLKSRMASMSCHDDPVVNRIKIPWKHSRSETLGRWHPSGCDRGGESSGSMVCQTASWTSRSRARRMCGDLPGRRCWIALDMKIEPTSRPVDGHHPPAYPRES